jgi:hypothetical protein
VPVPVTGATLTVNGNGWPCTIMGAGDDSVVSVVRGGVMFQP